jgi:hypothetical protein
VADDFERKIGSADGDDDEHEQHVGEMSDAADELRGEIRAEHEQHD